MRNSKVLKMLCYLLIPIFLFVVILASIFEILKYNYDDFNGKDAQEYFNSEFFLEQYMSILAYRAEDLIYRNNKYKKISDGEFKICYIESDDGYYYNQIKNNYYLIIYKNIALTNIELTIDTDTIEGLENYIQNCDGQKVKIENGEVEATSDIINNKAIQYFDSFENTYYSIVKDNQVTNVEKKNIESIEIEESPDVELNQDSGVVSKKEYFEVSIKDFLIYGTYSEELNQRTDITFYKELLSDLEKYESQLLTALPICSVIVIVMIIYLIIAIGHVKGKEGIDINDLDKIPIEIVFCVFCLIICLPIALVGAWTIEDLLDIRIIYSLSITAYLIAYIDCAILCVTIIKRIKAKRLIKDSLCAKILRWIIKIIKNIWNKIENAYTQLTQSLDITLKLCIGLVLYVLLSIFLVMIFSGFGFILSLIGIGFILYELIKRINCYKNIENHLKAMYEGDHSQKLNSYEFTKEFQDIIKYINDVSSGFENAIQEGIKSERMKTELITNVSHDIKTPLTSIINYVDLLKKEEVQNEKAKEYIEILDSKSQRLKKLTEDLVEASKASSGSVKLNIEKLDITELVKQSIGEFEDKFESKKLEIISNIPEEKLYINADNRYMYRIIENLFSNISKYALDSSRVYIDVIKKDKKINISIKNISKDRLNISADELMQRFVRGDKSRTTEGSGLGISISKSLTELQKGKFTLNVDGDLFKVELEFNLE